MTLHAIISVLFLRYQGYKPSNR